ncbi:PAS domain S-box-containing protein [Anaerosolibacter carboniphilus]|uniref:histidine kinase n=1 Tax=Anaerosolibacter carboniphilus TaxID=1417629 RepID=A0A841KPG5_9FIRM|nr:PAS domain-containing sensor histidine kinase [Anaerosolibacter carboniphilus]MBB6215313.1 PAS domain S-box-containing protein [Anaerosolibacter carboniphilus]
MVLGKTQRDKAGRQGDAFSQTQGEIILYLKNKIMELEQEIQQRKKIEKALCEREEHLKQIVDNTIDIISKTNLEGILQYVTPSHEDILGYTSADLLGKPIFALIHPDDRQKLMGQFFENVSERVSESYKIECRYRHARGHYVWLEAVGKLIYDQKNQPVGAIFCSRDITQRKEDERALKLAMECDEVKTEFFTNISHELKTPINVILGSNEMIDLIARDMEDAASKEKLVKYIRMVKQNCYRLIRLVNNFIDRTKIDSGYIHAELGNYDIVRIVEDITLSVAEYIGNKGVDMVFDTSVEEKVMACDPDKIERIILNLLSNAIKFTSSGGQISVHISEEKDNIHICVKDTGEGIPKEKQDEIFKRFIQCEKTFAKNQEGSGIGLSLVKSLVEMHHGRIILKSEVGQGSEFEIVLPVKRIEAGQIQERNTYYSTGNIERIHIEFSDIYVK